MAALGFFALAIGGFLISSAIKGRPPLTTLREMIQEPTDIQGVLARNDGTVRPAIFFASESGADSPTTPTTPPASFEVPAHPSGLTTESVYTPGVPYTAGVSDKAVEVVSFARAQLGKPYRWGGNGPDAFDCSGLTQQAYLKVGVKLGRTTYAQAAQGKPVKKADLLPGDLVFPTPGHVQMYIGNGQIIEAPRTGLNIRIKPLGIVWKARRYV